MWNTHSVFVIPKYLLKVVHFQAFVTNPAKEHSNSTRHNIKMIYEFWSNLIGKWPVIQASSSLALSIYQMLCCSFICDFEYCFSGLRQVIQQSVILTLRKRDIHFFSFAFLCSILSILCKFNTLFNYFYCYVLFEFWMLSIFDLLSAEIC